ncbi:tandem-95 repeat protein [Salegentibacter sp. BLCTC]|uniref:Ig-like domain-containing protein n=1 Tax=Salegentibacter sp. BLCTC TaxID=2697368 RepID=UPI00187B5A75|nr:Ig-like domain-containing protein [Salegentibacter sp. BLCTC]MBE7641195.1 tandem-95 repeat protein [Salegentibacter sp. BLCTC]
MKHDYFTLPGFSFRLLPLHLSTVFFLFLFLLNFTLGFGQDCTITSTASNPTDESPIPLELNFEGPINRDLVADDFDLTNGGIGKIERGTPGFENSNSSDINDFPVIAGLTDFFLSGYDDLLDEEQRMAYLSDKISQSIISIDVDSDGDIFYLTFADGVFQYLENEADKNIIGGDKFSVPLDMVIDNNDRIIVADPENLRVRIFGQNGVLDYDIGGGFGNGSGDFYGPTGLAVNDDNILYVADQYAGEYCKKDDDGKCVNPKQNLDLVKLYNLNSPEEDYIRQYGFDVIDDPYRIAVDAANNVYVSDSGDSGRVLVFNDQDQQENTILGGSSDSPGSIIIDDFGYVYVINYNGELTFSDIYVDPLVLITNYEEIQNADYQVDVYSPYPNLNPVTSFSKNLNLPIDLALDNCNNILVNDLELGGTAESILDIKANFDFDLETFTRHDNFIAEVTPDEEGEVVVALNSENDFFSCDPQPECSFSIVYGTQNLNTAPTAVDDVYAVDQDAILNESAPGVLENDTDAEADNLTASIVSTVSNGTLTLNSDGSFIYEPNTGYFGPDSFTYIANDGIEDSEVATVSITVNQVSPTNTAPKAVDDVYVVDQDAVLNESAPGVLENDTDAEADNLTANIVSTVSNGTLTLNPDGSFIYEPNTGYVGSDSFTYVANDGTDDSEVATVSITVNQVSPTNTAPTAVDDVYAVDQDAILNESAPGVLENDTDAEADNLTTSIVSTVSNGTLTLNSDGSFIYEPNTGYFGPDSFTYIANDGIDDSEVATVSITVNQVSPTNTAPKAVDDVYAVDQDAILNESAPGVLENDTDAEADNLTVSIVSTVSNGTLTLNSDGSFIYEPNTGYFGPDSFTYVANDGIEDSGVATVSITVNEVSPTNTAPTAVDDVYVVDQDAILNESAPGVLENDTDAEADNLTASIVSTVSNGTLTFNPDGSFIYEPNTDYFGSDSFTYIANDGNDDSEVATVTITVNSTNPNAPEIDCVNHELFLDENGQAVLNPGDLLVGEPGNLLITADKVNFDCTNLGANDVILTATDPETGLSSTCSASIFIIDDIFPVASCKIDYKVYLDNSGNATLAPEDLNNNSTDNCGIVSMALSQTEFTRADLGEVPITLTVRDEAGNLDSCETTVEVVEEASGNFECRESIVVYLDENGEAGLGLEELYTGDTSGITLEASQLRFNCNDVGKVSVQLDYSGAQTGSCSISVEVQDEIAPEIITDVVELNLDTEGFAYLEENDVLVQDNCNREFVYRFGKSVFSCEDVGSNTINVEVEDINGNIATKNIEVRVNGEACETPDDLKFLFIYPNPNNGIFTIVTPDGMTVEKVRVFDSRGRYILQQNYNVSGRFYRMSIEAVAESVYTLQILTNKGIVVKRVIVSR